MTSSIPSLEEKIAAARKTVDEKREGAPSGPHAAYEGEGTLWIWAVGLFAALILYMNVFGEPRDTLPTYDVAEVCAAQGGNTSECVRREREAYDGLSAVWGAQPSENRIWCTKALRSRIGKAPAGYAALALCVDQAAHGTRQATLGTIDPA